MCPRSLVGRWRSTSTGSNCARRLRIWARRDLRVEDVAGSLTDCRLTTHQDPSDFEYLAEPSSIVDEHNDVSSGWSLGWTLWFVGIEIEGEGPRCLGE